MPHRLTCNQLGDLLALLGGCFAMDAPDGSARIIGHPLPGDAVCAILPALHDHRVRVVVDLEKPNALAHVRQMLCQEFESNREPVAYPDGTVGLMTRPVPHARMESVTLAVAG